MKNLLKTLWLISFLRAKFKDKWNLELTKAFIEERHAAIFSTSENDLRNELAGLNSLEVDLTEDQLARKAELERLIGGYKSIQGIYGSTLTELNLVKEYIDYIKKCLKS